MLTPASPQATPTAPIMPGRSSLRTTRRLSAKGSSTPWSSIMTMRALALVPASVPETAWCRLRRVMRLTYSVVAEHDVSRTASPAERRGGGIHVRHRLLAPLREHALQRGQREDTRGPRRRASPPRATSRPSGSPSQRAAMTCPSAFGETEVGPDGVGGRAGGDVDGVGHEVAGECQDDLLGDLLARLVLGLLRARPEMRGHDDAGQAEERRARAGLRLRRRRGRHRRRARTRWRRRAPPRRGRRRGPRSRFGCPAWPWRGGPC